MALSCAEPPVGPLAVIAEGCWRIVSWSSATSTVCRTQTRCWDGSVKKTQSNRERRVGWVIPPQGNADFAAAMEKVLDVYRRPYDAAFNRWCAWTRRRGN